MYTAVMMETPTELPAVDGWFTMGRSPHLIGSRCASCAVTAFPPRRSCPNPACVSDELEPVELARTGVVWSYTDAQYQPPAPYVSPADPYQPFALAAVSLDEVQIVVLGQMVDGCTVDDLYIGMPVELVVEPLLRTSDAIKMMWRWKPSKEVHNA